MSDLGKHIVERPIVSRGLPERDEDMKTYRSRVFDHATQRGKPIAFRRGGGAAFGIVVPENEPDQKEHAWTLTGAPFNRGPITLREWLKKQGSVIDCMAPRGRNKPWTFRGEIPGKAGERNFSYAIGEDDDTSYIIIKRWEKQRKADEDTKSLGGARWWSKDATFDDPIEEDDEVSITKTWPEEPKPDSTALDSPEDPPSVEAKEGDKVDKTKTIESSGQSPPRKKAKGYSKKKEDDKDKMTFRALTAMAGKQL